MSTGLRSVHRGFNFSTEEGGIAMQRMQTNLSERRLSTRNLGTGTESTPSTKKGTLRRVLSRPRHFLRKKGPNSNSKDSAEHQS